ILGSFRWLPSVFAGLGLVSGLLAWRSLGRGSPWLMQMPLIGPWAQSLAELPYLEALRGLHSAGVPLLAAHPQAIAACRVASVRERLLQADRVLQQGRPLGEALMAADALHAETRHLLTTGERAGALEDALLRALNRRRSVAAVTSAALGRAIGALVY